MEPMCFTIQAVLQDLIESAPQRWTYGIFWYGSHSAQESLLMFGGGYYNRTEDEGKGTNSSSSSLIPVDVREHRSRVLHQLIQMFGPQDSKDDDAVDVEVSDTIWFFVVSMTQSFLKGSGSLGQAWKSSMAVWITGRETLAKCYCERLRMAQEFGICTLVFIPSEIGVIELGSTGLNVDSGVFVDKAMKLLNNIHSWGLFRSVQPLLNEDESESSNSVGNSIIVGKNPHMEEDEELSLELRLSFKTWPVKPESKSDSSSSSSVCNYLVPVVKEKERPQFSGKLQLGSNNNNSDSTDMNAFICLLRGRR